MNAWERISRTRKRYESLHTRNIERSLRIQIAPVVEKLGLQEPEGLISQIDTLIVKDPINKGFNQLYGQTGKDFARSTFLQVHGKGLKAQFDDIWFQEMIKYAEMYLGERITSITAVSRERAIKILRQIISEITIPEGLGITDTRKLIQSAFVSEYIGVKRPYTITGRARVIAQTEVLTASNRGSHLGAESAGATKKTWLTSGIVLPDQEPRHVGYPGLEGQVRKLDEPFSVRGFEGMHPGDPSMPASEVVNCKCALAYERE